MRALEARHGGDVKDLKLELAEEREARRNMEAQMREMLTEMREIRQKELKERAKA